MAGRFFLRGMIVPFFMTWVGSAHRGADAHPPVGGQRDLVIARVLLRRMRLPVQGQGAGRLLRIVRPERSLSGSSFADADP